MECDCNRHAGMDPPMRWGYHYSTHHSFMPSILVREVGYLRIEKVSKYLDLI